VSAPPHPQPPLPVDRLVLWRHGRTAWNAAGRFQGQLDPPLDEIGRDQAIRSAPYLAASAAGGLDPARTVVVSSDLGRATATATALTDLLGIEMRVDRRLREHGLGAWEGLTRDEVVARYPDQYADWVAGRPVQGRGGERYEEVVSRALAALADLPRAHVAVAVTHGGTSRRVLEALLGLDEDHRRLLGPLGNCGWSELAHRDGRWQLLRHNTAVPAADAGRPAAGDTRALHAVREPAGETAGPRGGPADEPVEDADAV
jgi:probable phosphoglycerate mutase